VLATIASTSAYSRWSGSPIALAPASSSTGSAGTGAPSCSISTKPKTGGEAVVGEEAGDFCLSGARRSRLVYSDSLQIALARGDHGSDPTPAAAMSERSEALLRKLLGAMSIFTLLMTVPQVLTDLGRQAGGGRLRAFVERLPAVRAALVLVRLDEARQKHLPAVHRLDRAEQRGDRGRDRLRLTATREPVLRSGIQLAP
jgi:hypothetical protein